MNEGRRENTRLNIGRHDKSPSRNPCSFLSQPFALASRNRTPFSFFCIRCLASYCAPCSSLPGPRLLTPFIAKASGTIKNLPSHRMLTSQMRLLLDDSHTLSCFPTSRKAACDKLSITNNAYLVIYTPRCNIPLFLAMQVFLPLLHTIYPLPPQYTPYSHIFSPYIYTSLQKRHNSPHNP